MHSLILPTGQIYEQILTFQFNQINVPFVALSAFLLSQMESFSKMLLSSSCPPSTSIKNQSAHGPLGFSSSDHKAQRIWSSIALQVHHNCC